MSSSSSDEGRLYDERFFASQVTGSLDAARPIARLVCQLFRPASVVDIGCGVGA